MFAHAMCRRVPSLRTHSLSRRLRAPPGRSRPITEHLLTLLERDEEVERPMGIDLGGAVAADHAGCRVVSGKSAVGTKHDHDRADRIEDRRNEVALVDKSRPNDSDLAARLLFRLGASYR